MEFLQLRCFVAVAEELHFGRAAQRLGMLPAAFGRHIRLLEDDLGTPLFARTTRSVALTPEGATLLPEARELIGRADGVVQRFRQGGRTRSRQITIGAIDSAAAGMIPPLLIGFARLYPAVAVQVVEDKTVKLLPRLLSGRLDLAFVRPPESLDARIETRHILDEFPVVAVPETHALAQSPAVSVHDFADTVMIVPDRRSRPHSHDLTIRLFADAGLQPKVAQLADEKQTIVSLVASGLGIAIVPVWTSRIATGGVVFLPLKTPPGCAPRTLPLAAAWLKNTRDPLREAMLNMLADNLPGLALERAPPTPAPDEREARLAAETKWPP